LNNFHEYLIQYSLKSGCTKDHFRWVKVPGTAPYWKACSQLYQQIVGNHNYSVQETFEDTTGVFRRHKSKKGQNVWGHIKCYIDP
jgi:hypothetical protein